MERTNNFNNVNANINANGSNNINSNCEFKGNVIERPENELEVKRFGHSITLINGNQVVLFGGAKSVTDLYNDTFIYNIKEKSWLKFEPYGDIPSPRAAHAACCTEKDNLVVFGGANKNGGFASNELYILEIMQDKSKSKWSILTCKDPRPQRRYGHTMLYVKPNLIVFGGVLKEKNKLTNEVWLLNLEKPFKDNLSANINQVQNYTMTINEEASYLYDFMFEWKLIDFDTQIPNPVPRMYHTAGVCKSGRAKGMILIFGGRGDKNTSLGDAWGLRKHRDGNWEWVLAPCINKVNPVSRYQHSAIFYSNKMLVLGGLGDLNEIKKNGGMLIEIFDCDALEWSSHFHFNKFRHSSFILEKYVFTFGGCDYTNPVEPTDKFVMFDVQELCNNIRK